MAKALDQPPLYDRDYVAWLDQQVRHLRAGRLAALDVENVALELSPGLKREVEPVARDVCPDAIEQAAIETGLSESALPQTLPCTVEQIFGRGLPIEKLPE